MKTMMLLAFVIGLATSQDMTQSRHLALNQGGMTSTYTGTTTSTKTTKPSKGSSTKPSKSVSKPTTAGKQGARP